MKCYGKSKNENVQFNTNWGLEGCGMMRGFQIWSQNLNQKRFYTLFGQKTAKI